MTDSHGNAQPGDPLERLRAALADRYAVEDEVGQGGMATVYRARDLKHDRTVAIKVLRPELAASLGVERFLREIRLAARLQHPNILPLYDSGEADSSLYYIMPFVQGESLRDRLNREQQLSLTDALQITREAGEALSYAHSLGVIHRDIKPENILLSGGHALVADFGIARAVDAAGSARLTETGMTVGSPTYMSPEQAQAADTLDGRSDLYSLACVLYEMLIGQPPFVGPTAMAILARHSLDSVPRLQIVREAIPDQLEDAILQALAKVPADRFATVHQFLEALPRPEDLTTGARRRLSQAAAATPHRRRLMRAVGLGLGGLTLAATVVGGGFWLASQSRRGGDSARGLDPRRLAVLYLADLSPDHQLRFLADAFTETLIHELSGVSALQVVSRAGVLPFRDRPAPPDSIGRALQVGSLVDGTVTQSGDRLRVSVALINAATGTEIASQTLERPRAETFALQEDLATEVSRFLRRRLGQEIGVRELRAGTRNVAAWELVQQAQGTNKDYESLLASDDAVAAGRKVAAADSLLAAAEALDRNWATPPTERGWLAYRQSRLYGMSDRTRAARWIGEGLAHAAHALTLDPDDPDALELRGTLRYWRYLLNLEPSAPAALHLRAMAEEDLRASVAANPDQAGAWTSLTHLLMNKSETAEAKLAALRAYEADPYLGSANVTLWRLFQSSLDLEDQVEANHWCEEGRRRFANDLRFVECQLWLFTLKDQTRDVPEEWRLLERYVEMSPPPQQAFRRLRGQMLVAMGLARAGLADSARRVAERSRGDARIDQVRELAFFEAIVRNLVGDRDEAFRMLNTFYAANPSQRASLARDQTWWFRNLHDDPRYQSLAGTPR